MEFFLFGRFILNLFFFFCWKRDKKTQLGKKHVRWNFLNKKVKMNKSNSVQVLEKSEIESTAEVWLRERKICINIYRSFFLVQ